MPIAAKPKQAKELFRDYDSALCRAATEHQSKAALKEKVNSAARIATSHGGGRHAIGFVRRLVEIAEDPMAIKENLLFVADSIMRHAERDDPKTARRFEKAFAPHVKHLFKAALRRNDTKQVIADYMLKKIIPDWRSNCWFRRHMPGILTILKAPALPGKVEPAEGERPPLSPAFDLAVAPAEEEVPSYTVPSEYQGAPVEPAYIPWVDGSPRSLPDPVPVSESPREETALRGPEEPSEAPVPTEAGLSDEEPAEATPEDPYGGRREEAPPPPSHPMPSTSTSEAVSAQAPPTEVASTHPPTAVPSGSIPTLGERRDVVTSATMSTSVPTEVLTQVPHMPSGPAAAVGRAAALRTATMPAPTSPAPSSPSEAPVPTEVPYDEESIAPTSPVGSEAPPPTSPVASLPENELTAAAWPRSVGYQGSAGYHERSSALRRPQASRQALPSSPTELPVPTEMAPPTSPGDFDQDMLVAPTSPVVSPTVVPGSPTDGVPPPLELVAGMRVEPSGHSASLAARSSSMAMSDRRYRSGALEPTPVVGTSPTEMPVPSHIRGVHSGMSSGAVTSTPIFSGNDRRRGMPSSPSEVPVPTELPVPTSLGSEDMDMLDEVPAPTSPAPSSPIAGLPEARAAHEPPLQVQPVSSDHLPMSARSGAYGSPTEMPFGVPPTHRASSTLPTSPSEMPVPTELPSPTSEGWGSEEIEQLLDEYAAASTTGAAAAQRRHLTGSPTELPVPTFAPSPTSIGMHSPQMTEPAPPSQARRGVGRRAAPSSPTEIPVPTEVPISMEVATQVPTAFPMEVASMHGAQPTEVPTIISSLQPTEVPVPSGRSGASRGATPAMPPPARVASRLLPSSPTEMPVPTQPPSPTEAAPSPTEALEPPTNIPTAVPTRTEVPTAVPPGPPETSGRSGRFSSHSMSGAVMSSDVVSGGMAPRTSPTEMPMPTEVPSTTEPSGFALRGRRDDGEEMVRVPMSATPVFNSATFRSSGPPPSSPTELPVPTELPSPTSPPSGAAEPALRPLAAAQSPQAPFSSGAPMSQFSSAQPAPVTPTGMPVPTEIPSPTEPSDDVDEVGVPAVAVGAAVQPVSATGSSSHPIISGGRTMTSPTDMPVPTEMPSPTSPAAMDEEDVPAPAAALSSGAALRSSTTLASSSAARMAPSSPTDMPVPTEMPSPTSIHGAEGDVEVVGVPPPMSSGAVLRSSVSSAMASVPAPTPTDLPVPTERPSPTSPGRREADEEVPPPLLPPSAAQRSAVPGSLSSAPVISGAGPATPTELPVPTELPSPTSLALGEDEPDAVPPPPPPMALAPPRSSSVAYGSAIASAPPPSSPTDMPVPTELPSPTEPSGETEDESESGAAPPPGPVPSRRAAPTSPTDLVPAPRSGVGRTPAGAPSSPTDMPVPTELPSPTSIAPEEEREGVPAPGAILAASPPHSAPLSATAQGSASARLSSPTDLPVPTELPSPTSVAAAGEDEEVPALKEVVPAAPGDLRPGAAVQPVSASAMAHSSVSAPAPSSPTDMPVPTELPSPTSVGGHAEEVPLPPAGAFRSGGFSSAMGSARLPTSPTEMPVPTELPSPGGSVPEPPGAEEVVPIGRPLASALLSSSRPGAPSSPTDMPVPTEMPSPTSPAGVQPGEDFDIVPQAKPALAGSAEPGQASAVFPSADAESALPASPTDMPVPTELPSPSTPVAHAGLEDAEVPVPTAVPSEVATHTTVPTVVPTNLLTVPTNVPDQEEMPTQVPDEVPTIVPTVTGTGTTPGRYTTPSSYGLHRRSSGMPSSPTELPVPTEMPTEDGVEVPTAIPSVTPATQPSVHSDEVDQVPTAYPLDVSAAAMSSGAPGASPMESSAMSAGMAPPTSPTDMPVPTDVPSPTSPALAKDAAAREAVAQVRQSAGLSSSQHVSKRAAPSSPTDMPVPTEMPSPTTPIPAAEEEDVPALLPAAKRARLEEPDEHVPAPAVPESAGAQSSQVASGQPTSPTDMPVPTEMPSPTSVARADDEEGVPTAVPLVEVPRAKRIREEEHIPQSAAMGSSGMPIDSPTELPVPTDMPSPTSFVPRDQALALEGGEVAVPEGVLAASAAAAAGLSSVSAVSAPESPTDMPVPTDMPSMTSPAGQDEADDGMAVPVAAARPAETAAMEDEEIVAPLPASAGAAGDSSSATGPPAASRSSAVEVSAEASTSAVPAPSSPTDMPVPTDVPSPSTPAAAMEEIEVPVPTAVPSEVPTHTTVPTIVTTIPTVPTAQRPTDGGEEVPTDVPDEVPTAIPPAEVLQLAAAGPPESGLLASAEMPGSALASSPTEMPVPTDLPSPTSPVGADELEEVPIAAARLAVPLAEATSPAPPAGSAVHTAAASASAPLPESPSEMPVPTDVPSPTSHISGADETMDMVPTAEAPMPAPPRGDAVAPMDEDMVQPLGGSAEASASAAIGGSAVESALSADPVQSSPTEMPVPTDVPSPTSPVNPDEAAEVLTVPIVPRSVEALQPPRAVAMATQGPPESPSEMPVPTEGPPSPTSPVPLHEAAPILEEEWAVLSVPATMPARARAALAAAEEREDIAQLPAEFRARGVRPLSGIEVPMPRAPLSPPALGRLPGPQPGTPTYSPSEEVFAPGTPPEERPLVAVPRATMSSVGRSSTGRDTASSPTYIMEGEEEPLPPTPTYTGSSPTYFDEVEPPTPTLEADDDALYGQEDEEFGGGFAGFRFSRPFSPGTPPPGMGTPPGTAAGGTPVGGYLRMPGLESPTPTYEPDDEDFYGPGGGGPPPPPSAPPPLPGSGPGSRRPGDGGAAAAAQQRGGPAPLGASTTAASSSSGVPPLAPEVFSQRSGKRKQAGTSAEEELPPWKRRERRRKQ